MLFLKILWEWKMIQPTNEHVVFFFFENWVGMEDDSLPVKMGPFKKATKFVKQFRETVFRAESRAVSRRCGTRMQSCI